MSHANAALTPKARLRLARLVVEDGWKPSEAAKMFVVSTVTARKWAARFRAEGPTGMKDRSSRPRTCPNITPAPVRRAILELRWRRRLGPVQIGGRLGVPPSTVHAVLVRVRVNRLSRIDRVTGEPIRRYEHPHPGSLIHVDITKFGNVPDGGGHRYLGRAAGKRNRTITAHRTGQRSNAHRNPLLGTAFLYTVVDATHASPTSRSVLTRRPRQQSECSNALLLGSPTAESLSSVCSPTTAVATALSPGAMRAKH